MLFSRPVWIGQALVAGLLTGGLLSSGATTRALSNDPMPTAWAGQQPRLAHRGDRVFLTFVRDNTIHVLRSNNAGAAFSETGTIAIDGKIAAGRRRGPRINVTNKALLVTGIVGAKGGGADGDILLYRSTDEGRSFAKAVTINDVPGSAREGMHGMAANDGGLVVVTWLDLRQRGTRIYAAVSRDHGATWAPDVLVYESPTGSVCQCCHPSAAVSDDGRIAIMFRNELGEYRDMYVARSRNGKVFEPAVKLGSGSWTLNACPMDGGGIELAAGHRPTTVWRREDSIFTATLDGQERRLGTGRDPALAIAGSNIDIAWTATDGLMLMRGDRTVAIASGQFPVLLAFDKHTLLAWEHQGHVLVRQIPR